MSRTKKPSREDLEREIARLKPYADCMAYHHNPGKYPPVTKTQIIECWGGRVRVTVNYYGYWRNDCGVIETIAQPLRDNGCDGDGPVVEAYAWSQIWDRVGRHAATATEPFTAPWRFLIEWVLTDGLRLQDEENDRQDAMWRAVDEQAAKVSL